MCKLTWPPFITILLHWIPVHVDNSAHQFLRHNICQCSAPACIFISGTDPFADGMFQQCFKHCLIIKFPEITRLMLCDCFCIFLLQRSNHGLNLTIPQITNLPAYSLLWFNSVRIFRVNLFCHT